ncbi:serine/threonine-protein kinase [Microbispora hainanensis]|uniref:non-specific serine/threonine protein kinase n=1 Tax=Microbispora hainanensis TaxID=568844 RepID=A0A544YEM7_9ACTN|nr:serine/threonine-protein kinase [Microbispora hainanensis]TQS15230.1 protein kinase [Microbispora hainanensis]
MPEGQGPVGRVPAGGAPEGQGRLVGRRYRLLSPVGRGGMGMVWHAHDVLLDRDVAVKELLLPFGLDNAGAQAAHRRMLREARSAARLSHPGIVTVHDVVEEDGRPWIVMELVRAWSLEQAVRQSGPLPVVQAAEIGIRVLDALRHAHAAGILHRDVKPGNVLLTADRVVLTDFGIAAIEGDVTITQTGLLMGSPAYIPPERLQGRPITHAADLWSFGATLYAAVEGRPPYEGPDAVAVLGAVLTQEPNRPRRAGALLPVIEGLLRKNPADRLPAAQVAEMLERVLHSHGAGLPGRAGTPTSVPTPQDSTPAGLLPPLDIPSGPLPSRIIETPSGPVRVPLTAESLPGGAAVPPGAAPRPAEPHAGEPRPADPAYEPPGAFGPVNPFGQPPAFDPAFDAAFDTGFDPLSSPSGSTHAPERPKEAMWPTPAPGDMPGDLGGAAWPQHRTGPHAAPQQTGPHAVPQQAAAQGTGPQVVSSQDDFGAIGDATGPHSPRAGRRRKEQADELAESEGRSKLLLAVAAAAVVAVIVGIVFVLLPSGPDEAVVSQQDGRSGHTLAPPDATTPTARPLSAVRVPQGYHLVTEGGVSLAVPKEWSTAVDDGVVRLTGPKDSGQSITIKRIPDGSLSALQSAEQNLDIKGFTDYTQVQLRKVGDYRYPAADWEYTYTNASEVTVHAVIRYLEAGDRAYAIMFASPDFDWNESAAPVRQALWSTFRPA